MKEVIILPAAVEEIIRKLNEAGYEAYAVGGCVRDCLLGKTPQDWDITTSALPGQIKQLFKRTIDTGIEHGTVTIMQNRIGYEVTTYRVDGEYLDGRHPSDVTFTADLKDDLRRRDFTINAMAYHPQTGLVDVFEGAADLDRQRIRCVGDPLARFGEDALRMLRAIRFSAQLGFVITSQTFQAIEQLSPNLRLVSKERIQSELTKLLLSDHPQVIEQVQKTGLAAYVANDFYLAFVNPLLISQKFEAQKAVRWAGFLTSLSPDRAAAILQELKMDHETIKRVRLLLQWQDYSVAVDKVSVRKVMSQMTPQEYQDLLCFWQALNLDCPKKKIFETVVKISAEIIAARDCLYLSDLAVNGSDLIAAGIKPGKQLGEILNHLLEAVLERPEDNIKESLLAKIL